jgi:hypothetical protein
MYPRKHAVVRCTWFGDMRFKIDNFHAGVVEGSSLAGISGSFGYDASATIIVAAPIAMASLCARCFPMKNGVIGVKIELASRAAMVMVKARVRSSWESIFDRLAKMIGIIFLRPTALFAVMNRYGEMFLLLSIHRRDIVGPNVVMTILAIINNRLPSRGVSWLVNSPPMMENDSLTIDPYVRAVRVFEYPTLHSGGRDHFLRRIRIRLGCGS